MTGGQPMELLWHEHRLIERGLVALDVACERVRRGEPVALDAFRDIVDFLRNFADGWHHAKEEQQLLSLWDERAPSHLRAPLGTMMDDHAQGRAYVDLLANAWPRLDGGGRVAMGNVVSAGVLYTDLLRRHIAWEDGTLYPLVVETLRLRDHDELAARCGAKERRIRQGAGRRYLALVESLERRLGLSGAPSTDSALRGHCTESALAQGSPRGG